MSADDSLVFVDTNVLVYAYDRTAGEKRSRAKSLIDTLWMDARGCISLQVLQEFYVTVTTKIPRPLKAEVAAEIVRDLSYWRLHAPVAEDVLGAIDLQQRQGISFWDAMNLWSAQQLDCETIWSEDLSQGQRYNGVRVVNPFSE
jgi:predicted nucleic acid-binding protein